VPGACLEDLCFNAQQAAEKAIKGVLKHLGIPFPPRHDLAQLLGLLEKEGEKIPAQVRASSQLTVYAVDARYPGSYEPVNWVGCQDAIATAEAVVRWAEERIKT